MTTPRHLCVLLASLIAAASTLRSQPAPALAETFNAEAVGELERASFLLAARLGQETLAAAKYPSAPTDSPASSHRPTAYAKKNGEVPAKSSEKQPKDPIYWNVQSYKKVTPEPASSPPEFRPAWSESLKDLAVLSQQLKATPVAHDYADEIVASARLIGFLAEKSAPGESDRQLFLAASRDLAVKRRQAEKYQHSFAEPIQVEVHTKDSRGQEVKNLEVHFRRAPDPITKAIRFDLLSSPTTRGVRAGVYYFWSVTTDAPPKRGRETLFDVAGQGQTVIELSAP